MVKNYNTISFHDKLFELNWLLLVLIFLLGCIGVAMIYSATGGQWNMGAKQHFIRLLVGMVFMIAIAMINIRVWFTLAYPGFLIALGIISSGRVFWRIG